MSEENDVQKWEYIQPDDLIAKPTFPSSAKAGYVEEAVDIWAKESREKFTDLANNFNIVLHKYNLSETELSEMKDQVSNLTEANQRLMSNKGAATEEELAETVAELESVKAQYNELLENYEMVHARNIELEQAVAELAESSEGKHAEQPATVKTISHFDRAASAEDGYTYVIEYTGENVNVARVREFPELEATGKNAEEALSNLMDLVDDALRALQAAGEPFPQPGAFAEEETGVAETSEYTLDNAKVSAILDAAANEASELVKRTQENMARLEAAARREAESIVAEAHQDAADSREEADRNREESAAIRSRMIMLFESQLAELKSNSDSVGYNPTVSSDAHELRRSE